MKKLLVLIALVLSGCATTGKYKEQMNGMVGQNIKQVFDVRGYPTGSFADPDGNNTVYVFVKSSADMMPSVAGESHTVMESTCKTYVHTDKGGQVVSWHSEGNNCVAN